MRTSPPTRRTFIRAGGAVAAGAILGGCGAGGAGVTLELWTWALRPRFDDYMTRLVAAFEDAHPGVRVRWADIAFDAMRRKLFAAGAAGAVPDVVNLSDQHFAQFAGLGALRPLAGVLPGDPAARYVPGALAANVIDRRLLGLPWYLSTKVRVMNVPLLAEGGLTPATVGADWGTLLRQAGPFREATGAYLFTLPLGDRSDLPAMMLADGIEIVRPIRGGFRADLTQPAAVAFVGRWVGAYRAGLLPRAAATDAYEHMVRGVADRSVALINANALARLKGEAPRVYRDLAVGPGVTGALGAPDLTVTHVGVGRRTRHPELAAELAWHVTSPRWQTELAVEAGRVPSTTASLGDPAFQAGDGADPQAAATALGVGQLPSARSFAPTIGAWPAMRSIFDDAIKRALLDGADVATVLAGVEREWDRILRDEAAGVAS